MPPLRALQVLLGLYGKGLEQVLTVAKAALKVLDVTLQAGPAGQNENFLFPQVFVQFRALHPLCTIQSFSYFMPHVDFLAAALLKQVKSQLLFRVQSLNAFVKNFRGCLFVSQMHCFQLSGGVKELLLISVQATARIGVLLQAVNHSL